MNAPTTGTIATVDPKTLTIAMNVRTDANLDPDFVASVKNHGILQPPMVVTNDSGGYDVILGQRRTLAAVEAGLKEIPVYIVTRDAADTVRIIDQLTENDQRQQLTDAERVGGYKQLALFGVSPAQMVKRTNKPRDLIDKALAVGNAPQAEAAIADHGITLDQAAIIAQFTDPNELSELLKTAERNASQLEHVAAGIIRERETEAAAAALEADLNERDITVLVRTGAYIPPGYTTLSGLAHPDTPTEDLTVEQVPIEYLAGRVFIDHQYVDGAYVRTPTIRYYVTSEAAEKHYTRKAYDHLSNLDPEQRAAREQREAEQAAERQAREERSRALAEAAEVRMTFLRENLLQRTKLPDFTTFMATLMLIDETHINLSESIDEVLDLLQITIEADEEDDDFDLFVRLHELTAADPKLKPRIALAAVLQTAESSAKSSWTAPALTAAYIEQLTEWGYTPSEAEQALVSGVPA